jgi:hypothetical protein
MSPVQQPPITTTAIVIPWLAGAIGLGAIAAATRLTLAHAAGGDPFSPIGSALVIFGALTVGCAMVAPLAWRDGRRILAGLICVAALSGEAFGLAATIERMAIQRAERARVASASNITRTVATQRLDAARLELADAVRRTADATKGGCRGECEALRANEAAARQRLDAAEGSFAVHGAARNEASPLAALLGVDPGTVEMTLATLFGLALSVGGAGLIAFATHTPHGIQAGPDGKSHTWVVPVTTPIGGPVVPLAVQRGIAALIAGPTPMLAPVPATSRTEQVRLYIQGFQAEHGREPIFTEVRAATGLPGSTVSRAMSRLA